MIINSTSHKNARYLHFLRSSKNNKQVKIKNLVQVMIVLHRSSTNSKNNSEIGIFIQVKITCKNLVMKKTWKNKNVFSSI